jgi:hypothetical protein
VLLLEFDPYELTKLVTASISFCIQATTLVNFLWTNTNTVQSYYNILQHETVYFKVPHPSPISPNSCTPKLPTKVPCFFLNIDVRHPSIHN